MKRESSIERYYMDKISKLGFIPYKFVSPGNPGVPDRLIFGQYPDVWLIEIKDIGGELSPYQINQIARLSKLGWKVAVLTGTKDLKGLYAYLQTLPSPNIGV